MRLGWRTPRVDSLKLAKPHKNWECAWSTQDYFRFLLRGCDMYSCWGNRTNTGLCETSWSIRLNCQLITNYEMMHMMQAQVCGCISAHPGLTHQKTKRENSDASKSQLNQASWNRGVLKFGSENKLNVHILLLSFNPFLWFSLDRTIWKKSRHCQFDWVCAAHL